jgi:ribosomal protein L37AE/L43A
MSFWRENPQWARRGPKTRRPAPICKTHSVQKVRQTNKTPFRCPECEREAWERGEQ